MPRQLYLAAYDVRNARRLKQMFNVLKDYACGGQKSAFECYLTEGERQELMARVEQCMDREEDAFLLIRLAGKDAVVTLGTAVLPADSLYTYLG